MNPSWIGYFVAAMLGHFVGDYLLQNQWMAIGKSKPGLNGHIACTVHVLFYTIAVVLFTVSLSPVFAMSHILHTGLLFLVVFIPHWIIDRWGLAWKFLAWKNGRSEKDLWDNKDNDVSNIWKIAFYAPVYIVNDNTFHWVCLWFTMMWFVRV